MDSSSHENCLSFHLSKMIATQDTHPLHFPISHAQCLAIRVPSLIISPTAFTVAAVTQTSQSHCSPGLITPPIFTPSYGSKAPALISLHKSHRFLLLAMLPVALQRILIHSLIVNLILPTTLTVAAVTQTSPSNSAIILPPAPLLTLVHNLAILRPLVHQVLQAVVLGSSRNTTTSLNWMEIPAPPHNSVVSQALRPFPPASIPLSPSMFSLPCVCRPPRGSPPHPRPLSTVLRTPPPCLRTRILLQKIFMRIPPSFAWMNWTNTRVRTT